MFNNLEKLLEAGTGVPNGEVTDAMPLHEAVVEFATAQHNLLLESSGKAEKVKDFIAQAFQKFVTLMKSIYYKGVQSFKSLGYDKTVKEFKAKKDAIEAYIKENGDNEISSIEIVKTVEDGAVRHVRCLQDMSGQVKLEMSHVNMVEDCFTEPDPAEAMKEIVERFGNTKYVLETEGKIKLSEVKVDIIVKNIELLQNIAKDGLKGFDKMAKQKFADKLKEDAEDATQVKELTNKALTLISKNSQAVFSANMKALGTLVKLASDLTEKAE